MSMAAETSKSWWSSFETCLYDLYDMAPLGPTVLDMRALHRSYALRMAERVAQEEVSVSAGTGNTEATPLLPDQAADSVVPHANARTIASDEEGDSSRRENGEFTLEQAQSMYLGMLNTNTIAIFLSYFNVGVALYFQSTPVMYYMVGVLDAASTATTLYSTMTTMPWNFKAIYGLLSDSVPILGYYRKPYFIIGWSFYILFNVILAIIGDANSNNSIIGLTFLAACGMLLADVMSDTMAVERAKLEPMNVRGSFQAWCYVWRSIGMVVGACAGAFVCNMTSTDDEYDDICYNLSLAEIYWYSALLPAVSIGLAYLPLVELSAMKAKEYTIPTLSKQIRDWYELLSLRSVYEPFVCIWAFGAFMVYNGAWYNYEQEGLGFAEFELGMITLAGAVVTLLALWLYQQYMINWSWVWVYAISQALVVIFQTGELVVIEGWNKSWGIPNYYFALGDSAMTTLVMSFQTLPACIYFVGVCKEGSEGATYSLLTTISNSAQSLGGLVSIWLLGIWDVDNSTLEEGDWTGMRNLTILTSCICILPILTIGFLPWTKEEGMKLIERNEVNYTFGTYMSMLALSTFLLVVLYEIVYLFLV